MTGFDIAVLLIVGIGAIFGFLRGFVQEILSLAAWVFAIFAIRMLHTDVTAGLEPLMGSESAAAVLAFALCSGIPWAVVKIVAKWAGGKSRSSLLGPVDRVLGLGFGAIKSVIIVVLGFSVLVLGYDTIWGVGGRPDTIKQAHTYPFINASSEALVQIISERRRAAITAESLENAR